MLAQLQERADVETAEVDRRGELLRIRLSAGGSVTRIKDELERMGFIAEEAPGDTGIRWYGPTAVGELSREEARVIAARVVPTFGAANALDHEQISAASALVADALYACFVGQLDGRASPGGLARSCGRAVAHATRQHLGGGRAAALGRAIESDLAGTSPA